MTACCVLKQETVTLFYAINDHTVLVNRIALNSLCVPLEWSKVCLAGWKALFQYTVNTDGSLTDCVLCVSGISSDAEWWRDHMKMLQTTSYATKAYLLKLEGKSVHFKDEVWNCKLGSSLQEQIQLLLCWWGLTTKHLEWLGDTIKNAQDQRDELILGEPWTGV